MGADGVLVRWLGTARFVPAGDIAFTETYVSGFGRNRHVGLRLHRQGGPPIVIGLGPHRMAEDEAELLRPDDLVAQPGKAGRGHQQQREGLQAEKLSV